MDKNLLSIDCGTQSLRAMIFSTKGELLSVEKVNYESHIRDHPGWAEQDPELYWDALVICCRKLKDSYPEHFSQIAGAGVTTIRNSMVNVDESGIPLRNAILWSDQRKSDPVYRPWPGMIMILRIAGMWDTVKKAARDGKCNWIRQEQPHIWNRTCKYLQVSGFLNYRLTGEFKDSVASQVGYIPFDYRRQKWGSGRGLFTFGPKLYPVEMKKLPELVQPGQAIGKITRSASEQTGLPTGLPVIACGSDKGCATLGAGVTGSNVASLCMGTAATIQVTSPGYREPIPHMPSYPSVIPGKFNPEVEVFSGFSMVKWFSRNFAEKEEEIAKRKGVPVEAVLDELLLHSKPGAMGLTVQPFWSPGLTEPAAKGAMIGFSNIHGKAEIYRAIIEGIVMELYDGKLKIEKVTGKKTGKVVVSGGASQNNRICQLVANVFDLPVEKGITHEASGLGAAIITGYGLGIFKSIETGVSNMVHVKHQFLPERGKAMFYKGMYQKIYRPLYKRLKPLYLNIRKLTGFPQ